MSLRLIYLPGGDAFIDDGETAVRLSDVSRLANYNPTGDLAGMTKFEIHGGGFGFLSAPLAEVLALFEPEPDPEPLTEEALKAIRDAAEQRSRDLLFRSA